MYREKYATSTLTPEGIRRVVQLRASNYLTFLKRNTNGVICYYKQFVGYPGRYQCMWVMYDGTVLDYDPRGQLVSEKSFQRFQIEIDKGRDVCDAAIRYFDDWH